MTKKTVCWGITLLIVSVSGFSCVDRKKNQMNYSEGLKISRASGIRSVPSENYQVAAGDLMDIKFFHHPEYNEAVRVRPDGKITIPLIHDFKCAGKTTDEIEKGLKDFYGHELKDPDIAVILREVTGYRIYICGEVKTTHVMPLYAPVTLLQAVIMSGGTLPSAREGNILVIRNRPDGNPETILVDLAEIRKGELPDVPLKPFDVVYVPKTAIANAGEFVDQYINNIIPRNLAFPFTYEIHSDLR